MNTPSQITQSRHRLRRWQRGVAATELALGLPVLFLVIFALISLGRMGFTKIRLESWMQRAVHECALEQDAADREIEACITGVLSVGPLGACVDGPDVDVELNDVAAVDDPFTAGEETVSLLLAKASCNIQHFGAGRNLAENLGVGFLQQTNLTATAEVPRQ